VMLFANCSFQISRLRVVSEEAIFRTQILKRKVYRDSQFLRKLPLLVDKQKVELSGRILAGGSNEEIAIYGKPDCWDIEGS
jgi:hypothetical protein